MDTILKEKFAKYRQSLVMQEQSELIVELITKHCYPLAQLPSDARISQNQDALVCARDASRVQYKFCALTKSKVFVQSDQIEQAL